MDSKKEYILTFDSELDLMLHHFVEGYERSNNPSFATTLIHQTALQNEGILTFRTQFNKTYAEIFFRETLTEEYVDVYYSEKVSLPMDTLKLEKELLTFMKRTNINYLKLRSGQTQKRAALLLNISGTSFIKFVDKSLFSDLQTLNLINFSDG